MNTESTETPSVESEGTTTEEKDIMSASNQTSGFGKKDKKEEVDYEELLMGAFPDEIRSRIPFVTIALMGASILMAIIMMCSAGSSEPDAQTCVAYGANFRPLTFGGQLWRLFTSAFIHFDIKHLAMNMLCLFSIGCFLEKLIGHVQLFCAYVLTAFTGGILSMLCHDNTVCAGASGAVFGLFAAGTIYILLVWREYKLNTKHVFGYMKNGLVFIGINFLYGLFPGVDMAAHIGGLLGGIGIGIVTALPERNAGIRYKEWFHKGVLIVTALLGAIMLVTTFTGRNANRLDTKALSIEVGKSIQETLVESMRKAGGKNPSVDIGDVTLFHDGGDNYHGLVKLELHCDGEHEETVMRINVTYDGEKFMWECKE